MTTTDLTTVTDDTSIQYGAATNDPTDVFLAPGAFEQAWRAAKMFASSSLVPRHLQGKPADCMVALGLAKELGDSPLHVMQAIYFISGRAGFSASYIISRANRSGAFKGPLRWEVTGQGPDLAVRCYATSSADGEPCEVTVTMAMAKDEGWTSNKKYKTMPEQMLRYRSAVWLVRLYCPEVMHGMHTHEELEDTYSPRNIERPTVARPALALSGASLMDEAPPAETVAESVTVDAELAR